MIIQPHDQRNIDQQYASWQVCDNMEESEFNAGKYSEAFYWQQLMRRLGGTKFS